MEYLPLLILGIILSTLGIVNIRGNISTIHSYNRRNVKEEDVAPYGRAVGTGTLVIGASLPFSYHISSPSGTKQRSIISCFRQQSSVWRSFCMGRSDTTTASSS